MKKFIHEAIKDGYLSGNPYTKMQLKISKGEARIDKFLTIEEIHRLETAVMPTASLKEARDLFLFACYTGISYVDLMTFDKSNIRTKDGTTLYSNTRHKTNMVSSKN